MSDIGPPTPARPSGPLTPNRDVKRPARARDHQADDQTAPIGHRDEGKGRDHSGDSEPAVVVSHPAAIVAVGDQISGEVVEMTPKNQPVLAAGSLRLLIESPIPLGLRMPVRLTIVEAEPTVIARIDGIGGLTPPSETRVPVLVLSLGTTPTSASGPSTYAPPSALRARLLRDQGHD